jgi:hypothetical protein
MKVKDNRQSIAVHKIEKIYSLFAKIYYILTINNKKGLNHDNFSAFRKNRKNSRYN